MAVGQPVDDRAADARHRAEGGAEPAAAQHQPPIREAVLRPLPHARLDVVARVRRDRRARDHQVGELRQREQAEHHRHQGQPLPEIEAVERPAQGAGLRIGADHGQHDAEARGRQAAQRRAARQHRDHGDAEGREGEKLRRAEIKHDRPQQRQRDGHQEGAEDAAQHRRHVGGAERPPGLAALRHGQAVENRRGRAGAARDAEHDGRDRIARGGRRAEAEQQREGRIRIHIEGERQQQRRAGKAADAGQDAEHQPHDDAGAEQHQPVWIHDRHQGLPGGVQHARVHGRRLSLRSRCVSIDAIETQERDRFLISCLGAFDLGVANGRAPRTGRLC